MTTRSQKRKPNIASTSLAAASAYPRSEHTAAPLRESADLPSIVFIESRIILEMFRYVLRDIPGDSRRTIPASRDFDLSRINVAAPFTATERREPHLSNDPDIDTTAPRHMQVVVAFPVFFENGDVWEFPNHPRVSA